MKSGQISETSVAPRDGSCLEGIKILRDINRLLTLPTRRDKIVAHELGTVDKASLMMLTSILADCGLDDAKKLLDSIQDVIHEVLTTIRDAPEPMHALHGAIDLLDTNGGSNVLTVHRTTVTNMIPHADRQQLDGVLESQYQECLDGLAAVDARSNAMITAIDDTHDSLRSRYFNGNYSYVHVGQVSTWERGFVYPAEYDATHQLFMGFRHQDYRLIDDKKKGLRPWMEALKDKCQMVLTNGIDDIIVQGDRGFYNASLFMLAHLGLLAPMASPGHEPRVVVPRKFTREKDDFKWNFLLDTTMPQVFKDAMNFSPYTYPELRATCEDHLEKNKKSLYSIPVACVAVIDDYSSKQKRSLEEIRSRALIVQDGLKIGEKDLELAGKAYKSHYKRFKGKEPKTPAVGRGARRKKFLDEEDKRLYKEFYRVHAKLEHWKKEKRGILKSIMFLTISILPVEDPAANPSKFIALARDYHERWGIENGFRDVKGRFLAKGRSRKPVVRQFRWTLGLMLYNRWEVERRLKAAAWFEEKADDHGLFDEHRPWIRRKHEQDCPVLPTAVGFLVDSWKAGILSMLNEKIKGEN